MVVPEINTQVVTTTGVNLRRNVPQPPNYKLEEKINVLLTNQRLKILDLKTFVDNTASSEHTVVWAEVGIP
jgi:serine/threonine-protein kinase